VKQREGTSSEFLKHLFPRIVRKRDLKLSYTLCLGGLALTSLLLCLLSGVFLLFYYQPTPEAAYDSVLFLEGHVPGGGYVRAVHRLTSDASLVLIGLHALRVFFTGAYQAPRRFNWVIGVSLLLLAVFIAYTGYLLPLDQTAIWATETGTALIRAFPGGDGAATLLAPDGPLGPLALLRYYTLHIALAPLALIALTALHFYRIRRHHGLLPYL
jgi:quinol-cytochrome oxidoreductase complex cytochrome b subunit